MRKVSQGFPLGIVFLLKLAESGAITPTALRACPVLRTTAGQRALLQSSGIRTYSQCFGFFIGRHELNSASSSLLSAVQPLLSGSALLLDTATSKCSASVTNTTFITDNKEGSSLCDAEIASLQESLNVSGSALSVWLSTCGALANQSRQTNVSLEQVENGLLHCLDLVLRLFNATKSTAATACGLLQSLNITSPLADVCVPAFAATFDALPSLAKLQTCTAILAVDAGATFRKLDALHAQLQKSFSISTAPSTESTLSVTQESVVVSCFSMFPKEGSSKILNGTNKTRSSRLCASICNSLRTTVETLAPLIILEKAPTMVMLVDALNNSCSPSRQDLQSACIVVGPNQTLTTILRPSRPSNQGFCLNLSCHYPLKDTPDQRHWVSASQSQLRQLYTAAGLLFPSATLPFNGSLLPCGFACAAVPLSAVEESRIRKVTSALATIGVLTSLLAVVAFLLNMSRLHHIVRRLNVYVNIGYLVGPGTDGLLAFAPSVLDSIACNSDGTLRENVPSAEGTSSCAFFAAKFMFGAYVMLFFGLGLCREWYLMILVMDKTMNRNIWVLQQKRREIVYVVSTLCVSIVFVILPLARDTVQGIPSTASCYITTSDLFYTITIPHTALAAIMASYLARGLPKLIRIYQGHKGFAQQISKQLKKRATTVRRKVKEDGRRQTLSTLENLVFFLLLYNVLIFSAFLFIPPIYGYLFAIDDDITDDIARHVTCLTTRCDVTTCPPLPSLSPAVAVIPVAYVNLVGVGLSLWALNWSAYWKRPLSRFRLLLCGRRSASMSFDLAPNPSTAESDQEACAKYDEDDLQEKQETQCSE